MPGGRPKLFKTPEELQVKIDDFYADCLERKVPLTLSRLACHLGVDRCTLLNYSKDDAFFSTIKKVKEDCQADLEERLQAGKGSAPGCIFAMKNNYNWKDKNETELTGANGGPVNMRWLRADEAPGQQ